jgi:hypothetical protein
MPSSLSQILAGLGFGALVALVRSGMPSPRRSKAKPAKPFAGQSGNALDLAQQKLAEEQQQLQEEIEALERTIKESPKRPGSAGGPPGANEAYVAGPQSLRAHYRHAATLAGASYMESPTMASRPRKRSKPVKLRHEKSEGRLQTIALLIALLGALAWLASRYFL